MLIKNKKLNISNIEKYLFTASGHPEIIIRTGGYKRLAIFFYGKLHILNFF